MSRFPNDKKVDVLRPDGTKYRVLESEHLMRINKYTESEVRISQAFNAQSDKNDFLAMIN